MSDKSLPSRASAGAVRSAVLALVAVLALGTLVGCGGSGDGLPADTSVAGSIPIGEEQQLFAQRARAVREDDLPAFLSTVDRTNPQLVARQRRYFANLQALPLSTFRYLVLPSQWPDVLRSPAWGADVSLPQVRVSTQLSGYDSSPVRRIAGFAVARRDGHLVILSELTGGGRQFPGSNPAPWDLVRIHVQSSPTTLQLFDDDTWNQRAAVAGAVDRGIVSIQNGVPWLWDGRVVVYVFAKQAVVNSFQGVPGGNINHLGAMTFPTSAGLDSSAIVGIRFTILPSSLAAGQAFLDRIIRHELTHVAVGTRDDGDPVWFAEGIAEYMASRELSPDQRRIATVAVLRARAGVSGMPASATFNGPDQAWHYALSWMACDYIAASQGEARLWELMDALHDNGLGTVDAQQDPVLERVIGMTQAQLAHRAASRILKIYG